MPTLKLNTFDDFINASIEHPHARFSVKNNQAIMIDGENDTGARIKGGFRDLRVFLASGGSKDLSRAVLAKEMAEWLYRKAQELPEENPFRYFGLEHITADNYGPHNVSRELKDRVKETHPELDDAEVNERIRKIRNYEQRVWTTLKGIPANFTWEQVNQSTATGSNLSLNQAVQNNMEELHGLAYLTPLPKAVKESIIETDQIALALLHQSTAELVGSGRKFGKEIVRFNNNIVSAIRRADGEVRLEGAYTHKGFKELSTNFFAHIDALRERKARLEKEFKPFRGHVLDAEATELKVQIEAIEEFFKQVATAGLTVKNIQSMNTTYWSSSGFAKILHSDDHFVQFNKLADSSNFEVKQQESGTNHVDLTDKVSRRSKLVQSILVELRNNLALPKASRKKDQDVFDKYRHATPDAINEAKYRWEAIQYDRTTFELETNALVSRISDIRFHQGAQGVIASIKTKLDYLHEFNRGNLLQPLVHAYNDRYDALKTVYQSMIDKAVAQANVYPDDPTHVFIPANALGKHDIISTKNNPDSLPKELIEKVRERYLASQHKESSVAVRAEVGLVEGDVYPFACYSPFHAVNEVIFTLFKEHKNRDTVVDNSASLRNRFENEVTQKVKGLTSVELSELKGSLNLAVVHVMEAIEAQAEKNEGYEPIATAVNYDPKVLTRLRAYFNIVEDEIILRDGLETEAHAKSTVHHEEETSLVPQAYAFNYDEFVSDHNQYANSLFARADKDEIIAAIKRTTDRYVQFSESTTQPVINVTLVGWAADDLLYRYASLLVDETGIAHTRENVYRNLVTKDISIELRTDMPRFLNETRKNKQTGVVMAENEFIRQIQNIPGIHPANVIALKDNSVAYGTFRLPSPNRASLVQLPKAVSAPAPQAKPHKIGQGLRIAEARTQYDDILRDIKELSVIKGGMSKVDDPRGYENISHSIRMYEENAAKLLDIIGDIEDGAPLEEVPHYYDIRGKRAS